MVLHHLLVFLKGLKQHLMDVGNYDGCPFHHNSQNLLSLILLSGL